MTMLENRVGEAPVRHAAARKELGRFAAFARKRQGVWRPFRFEHVPADLAERLNAAGEAGSAAAAIVMAKSALDARPAPAGERRYRVSRRRLEEVIAHQLAALDAEEDRKAEARKLRAAERRRVRKANAAARREADEAALAAAVEEATRFQSRMLARDEARKAVLRDLARRVRVVEENAAAAVVKMAPDETLPAARRRELFQFEEVVKAGGDPVGFAFRAVPAAVAGRLRAAAAGGSLAAALVFAEQELELL